MLLLSPNEATPAVTGGLWPVGDLASQPHHEPFGLQVTVPNGKTGYQPSFAYQSGGDPNIRDTVGVVPLAGKPATVESWWSACRVLRAVIR